MEWLIANWEAAYNIWGVGILGFIGFVWMMLKYKKLQKRYHDIVDKLYERAYDIALRIMEEKLKLEVSERIHAREKWEDVVGEYINELKKEKGQR